MTERDDPFLDLGYTSADDAVDLRSARLAKQKIDQVTDQQGREKKYHPSSYVRGFYEGEKRLSEEFPNAEDLSPEGVATNNEWIAKIRKGMGDSAIQRIVDSVHRMIPIDPDDVAKSEADRERMITARLRTRSDREEARKDEE